MASREPDKLLRTFVLSYNEARIAMNHIWTVINRKSQVDAFSEEGCEVVSITQSANLKSFCTESMITKMKTYFTTQNFDTKKSHRILYQEIRNSVR